MAKRAITAQQQQSLAGKLVERARAGDQNAMAIIALIRDNAINGNMRAQQSFLFLKQYIEANPINDAASKYLARPDRNYWQAIMFANGDRLSDDKIHKIAATLGDDDSATAFLSGVTLHRRRDVIESIKSTLHDVHQNLVELGRLIGQARALQVVRLPGTPISGFHEMTGWELGE